MTEPALTAEEWADWLDSRDDDYIFEEHTTRSHAAAAISLHGQPFGFTWEDVRDERRELIHLTDHRDLINFGASVKVPMMNELIERKRARIARIEALLPPEGS